jgi:hypothetical protein
LTPAISRPDLQPVPTLLLFSLVRSAQAAGGEWKDKIARHRANTVEAVSTVAEPRLRTHFSVLEKGGDLVGDLTYEGFEATQDWGGGSVDLLEFASVDDLVLAYEMVLRTQRHRAPDPAWSASAFAAQAVAVRPPGPDAAFRQFSIGGSLPDTTRSQWQETWRQHADKIPEASVFEGYLKSYVQYHLLQESLTGELGPADMHGIAHMGWASAKEMDFALSLPDYQSVLRTDENNLITKHRVTRVLALPDRQI